MHDVKRKTLLFLCKCGTNIANFVDIDAIESWAHKQDDIQVVEIHDLFCSPAGKTAFKAALTENKPDSIIMAACSPKMHEKTFQGLAEECGLNMASVQMANIREQCGWVTADKEEATSKAIALINAAHKRAAFGEDLEKRTMEVLTDVLIIGGGVAGIEAALMAAKAGRKVYIIEKDISLGGQVIKTEEVAPSMECAPCLLAPRLAAVSEDPNITVISNAEVLDILGFYGNFNVRVLKKARFVEDSCIGCEACFGVCPVDVKSDFLLGMGSHKAVHTLFPGSVPAAAVIDKEACLHFVEDSCKACVEACPFESINFEQQDEIIEMAVGAIVVATGFDTGDVSAFEELGYGRLDNVYTTSEFERIASSNGPFGSTIQLKNGNPPESIAIIHCAGSLRENGIPYCSGICCMNATKVGALAHHQLPNVKIYNIHNDLVYNGAEACAFMKREQQAGAQYIKCEDLTSVSISEVDGALKVKGTGFDAVTVDMVVLSTGLKPARGTAALAEQVNADLDEYGFFKADHDQLHETGSTIDGVYVAGCATGPCNVATAVTRSQAAVGDVLSKLMPGRQINLEVMTSVIDEELCAGCKLCLMVCPYKAIEYDAEKNVSRVNEALCRGCGTCTATCPSGASKARHFTDDQIYAEIGGLVHV